MSKKSGIRTVPVSLNESTLETNIVSEIAGLFNYSNGRNFPFRLHWFFDIPGFNPSVGRSGKAKIYRLTPVEEYDGGGWDSKISIPTGNGTSRAVFIQFKSGKHSDGNNFPRSIFNLKIKNPNKHAVFTFNDNSNNNQHQTLRNLHDELARQGLPTKSVLYGFPRITNLNDFENLEEDLLLHTTFLSLTEMDAKAANAGCNLYDGCKHHFRTCYYDETKREISSEPFPLNEPEDPFGFLYELVLFKYANWRIHFAKSYSYPSINEEFYLILSDFLRINPFKLHDFRYFRRFENEIKKHYSDLEDKSLTYLNKIYGENDFDQLQWRKRLFKDVVSFIDEQLSEESDILDKIPNNYSFKLTEEQDIKFEMGEDSGISMITF